MRIIIFIITLLPFLLQANSNLLLGEWIGMDKEYRLILKFGNNNLEIDALSKKSNSIYPQNFNYNVSNNNLNILSNSELLDSFRIITLKKNEMIIIMSGIKMAFHKSNLKYTNLNLKSVLDDHSFIVNYSEKVSPDTILNKQGYQFGLRNGVPCQSTEFNIFSTHEIHKSNVIELTVNNATNEIFVEEINGDEIIGKAYLNGEIIEVKINRFERDHKIENKNSIYDKILGNWTWITDKNKFLELKEKDHNTVFIKYRKVQFLDNFEYIEKINGQEYRGNWRIEQINGILVIQYKEGGSNEWGGLRKIKSITQKYIITEDIDYCNYRGHRNSINEYYYVRN